MGILARCIAITPPEQREWVPTCAIEKLSLSSPIDDTSARRASLKILLMKWDVHPDSAWKVLMVDFPVVPLILRMCWTTDAPAQTDKNSVASAISKKQYTSDLLFNILFNISKEIVDASQNEGRTLRWINL